MTPEENDGEVIEGWVNSSPYAHEMSAQVRDVFVEGRFAPYDSSNTSQQAMIYKAMARCPEVIDLLDKNGYQMTEKMLNTVWVQIYIWKSLASDLYSDDLRVQIVLERFNWDGDKMYQRIANISKRYPHYIISASCCHRYFTLHTAGFNYATSIPTTALEYEIWSQNDNLGPMPPAFKVIKRFFDEGKIFQDLEEKLIEKLDSVQTWTPQSLPMVRILYRLFPDILWLFHQKINRE